MESCQDEVEDAAQVSTPVAEEDKEDEIPELDQKLPGQRSSFEQENSSFHII